ncbi:Na+/H+ antiporter NhaA [Pseudogemmobacter faecipullorum]|uniref:Putative Na(+)/H(+) antiporter NhaA homolog n=1 Tax=Pseudogemmobacter faecipullorum TaxID=2755041 RepID=A0ABS8CIY4_9RHOB|nr:Na+/H+ antiporter NhaA [Pseudogemmobacter faecipullorum]MCB5409341.1 Na+/H+ antiporter NhaA [Pseudogemmobacter faecipullorum]
MYRISPHVRSFALALLAGVLLATLWVNADPASYYDFIEWRIADLVLPGWIWQGTVSLTAFMIVTDMLMALFFFVIGKELWEAMVLERGALAGKRAFLPMGLSFGGLAGAALAWLLLSLLIETAEEAVPGGGWTAPLGTDALLVCLFGRAVFGSRPALHLVMLIAIATDIFALLLLGFSKAELNLRLLWLLLPLGAGLLLHHRYGRLPGPGLSERARRAGQSLLPCLVAGALCWFGVAAAGMPASLGLLPLIPAIAHAERSFGLFAEAESFLIDPLNRLVRLLIWPVMVILFLFGLIRGGIDFAAFAPTTLVMLGSLWLGRPLGMILALIALASAFGARLPRGLARRDLPLAILLLSMGFTVPAVAIEASLPGGLMREAARMGMAISLLAGPLAVLLARLMPRHRPANS